MTSSKENAPSGVPPRFRWTRVGAAPKPQVGVVGLAGAVHAAAHHGDRDRILGRVAGRLAHPLGKLDKRLVLHPRATRATDDVQPAGTTSIAEAVHCVRQTAPRRRQYRPGFAGRPRSPRVSAPPAPSAKRGSCRRCPAKAAARRPSAFSKFPRAAFRPRSRPGAAARRAAAAANRRFTSTTLAGSESFSDTQ